MPGNGSKSVSISVKKFGDGDTVAVNDRSNAWSSWDDSLATALELAVRNYLSNKVKGLKLPQVDVASKWLLQPKCTQLALETSNGYPSLLQPDEDNDVDNTEACNLKRIEYSSWAQAALSAVLLENFQDSDAPIFKAHGILKSDAADLAKHPDREGEHNAFDNRIPYATNMYLALQAQFDTKSYSHLGRPRPSPSKIHFAHFPGKFF